MAPSAFVDYQRLEAGLQAHLGRHAAVACRSTDGDVSTLAPIERPAIARAIPHRRKEFAAGRSAAREAMQRLGRPVTSIPVQHDRSPQWPADLVGSISHSRETCISVVALKSHWNAVGVDVEPDQDLPRELWNLIGLPNEIWRASALSRAVQARWMTRIFSAKEAYYKWAYPQTSCMLNFHDVEIVMDPTMESTEFSAHPLNWQDNGVLPELLTGRLMIDQGMVISLLIQ
ncbi:4'-phosphopantetheinyl transferase [Hydrogenophaga sp.]|uniref:4'-phosphopantetheinyl transferase family protein n=1 Tax=Hydrogenophaga sp. TaxID=1904254 RepID=UPI0025C72E1B|nr:4'-phosphopantetheinyl transferase superfamily protein [Hydrogenophaga sp.]